MKLDFNAFGTQEKIWIRYHAELQENMQTEITNLTEQIVALKTTVDALERPRSRRSARTKSRGCCARFAGLVC
jgi:hypothetical protein